MKDIPWSERYRIDPATYPKEREERMIAHLDTFFWQSFFFLKMNEIQGDYVEFGSGSNIRSFRLAAKYRKLENMSMQLFAFDSFAGLPEPGGIDVHEQWKKGAMAVSVEQFNATMQQQGIARDEYRTVAGFYETTLSNHKPQDYGIASVAMVHIDCDLYASTVEALRFIGNVFADGCILSFDDWFCFGGSPAKGEQKAFEEFKVQRPDLLFVEYLRFGWHGASFLVHNR